MYLMLIDLFRNFLIAFIAGILFTPFPHNLPGIFILLNIFL
ncbi:hypothetical protein LM901004_160022 [Listeria monocytogenes]|nr:hypothetical protein LM901004_160022 [Listeria monocytogenes]